ncbi:hypothetical protein RclHR1_00690031 [Rhizophagus clarus]|uniref:Kinase-like domain-containing protein n=1 Tax=Rhizophagus clarus TaxID=94130 RepID=A0A2Z6RW69_9GLOM|nr:hypothetical protein RclHR1_00690031 [Rhizophagus clarus]GES83710.1 kinase-like domain-containing protein [Rhizophagus clarus]
MFNKTISAPVHPIHRRNGDNKAVINWIEDAISKKHIKYYDYKNFSNLEKIGSGGFGNVYRANWKNPHNILALKSLNDVDDATSVEKLVYELNINRDVHPYDNIIKFYGITTENPNDSIKKYMLVMEYADSGTLEKYLKENFNNLTWDNKLKMAYQLACAVSVLHDENIIHRDLHPKNVLVHQNTIKLADFGVSKKIDELIKSQSIDGVVPYVDPKKFTLEKKYSLDKKSDVYSTGVLLWEISSGHQPFKGRSRYSLMVQIPKGLRETPIPNTPADYTKIYTDCWELEADYRPNIHEVVNRLETIIAINNSISDSRSYNSNTNVQRSNPCNSNINNQRPILNSTNDIYSYNSNKGSRINPISSSTNNFHSHSSSRSSRWSVTNSRINSDNEEIEQLIRNINNS